jgi:hypothetical protein
LIRESLLTKEANEGLGVTEMVDFDVQLPLHFGPEHGRWRRTNDALEQLAFVRVLDGEMDLNRDFGVEHFLAQGTTVQMVSVNVH